MARTRLVAVTDADGTPILDAEGKPILADKVRIWPQLFFDPDFYDQLERWSHETRGKSPTRAIADLVIQTVEPLVQQHIAAHPEAPAKVKTAKVSTKVTKTPEELAAEAKAKAEKKEAAAKAAAERQQKSEAARQAQAAKVAEAAKAAVERAAAKAAQVESAGDAAAQRAAKQQAAKTQAAAAKQEQPA